VCGFRWVPVKGATSRGYCTPFDGRRTSMTIVSGRGKGGVQKCFGIAPVPSVLRLVVLIVVVAR